MSFAAVLFDLDGTLLDTLEDLGNAMNRVLVSRGYPTRSYDEYRYIVGEGARMLVMRALPENRRDETTIDECLAAYRADYKRNWNVRTHLYDGIADALDLLTARGLKLTVLSNKPHDSTVECVSEYLSRWDFAMVLGQREGIAHKPNPSGAIEIARQLQIAPDRFLYLGDTSIDMITAVRAEMFPVGVLWGFRTEEELRSHGARALLRHPREIAGLLDG